MRFLFRKFLLFLIVLIAIVFIAPLLDSRLRGNDVMECWYSPAYPALHRAVCYLESEIAFLEDGVNSKAYAVFKENIWRHIYESRYLYHAISCGDCISSE